MTEANNCSKQATVTLAMTGASGAQYGWRLLECLIASGHRVFFMISRAARVVSSVEADMTLPGERDALERYLTERYKAEPGQIRVFSDEQWMAPVASGSGAPSRMVICPASTGVLSAIATGASNNLIERAADVALKERRQLILVLRESPVSEIHLENMLKLSPYGGHNPSRKSRLL